MWSEDAQMMAGSPAPGLGDRQRKSTGGSSWITFLFLAGYSMLKMPKIRQRERRGDGAASEAALLLRGCERGRDSWGRSRPARGPPERETPRWTNSPDIWWDPSIAAVREVLALALTLPGFPLQLAVHSPSGEDVPSGRLLEPGCEASLVSGKQRIKHG